MFGAAHLDCLCEDNTCYACVWIENYYASHPELNAQKVIDSYGYVTYRVPRKDTKNPTEEKQETKSTNSAPSYQASKFLSGALRR
jgi:hypothetical protein